MNNTFIEEASTSVPTVAKSAIDLILESYSSIGDVELTLLAELDHRTISADELLHLEEGHVLRLARPAGENIDLFAGEVLLGSAEILVVDEKLAVRVADLRDKPTKSTK